MFFYVLDEPWLVSIEQGKLKLKYIYELIKKKKFPLNIQILARKTMFETKENT